MPDENGNQPPGRVRVALRRVRALWLFVALFLMLLSVVGATLLWEHAPQSWREAYANWLEGDGPPGFLYVEPPQVYTRERLVNDRFSQANWLRGELSRSADAEFVQRFAVASVVSRTDSRVGMSAGAPDRKEQEGSGESSEPAPPTLQVEVQVDPDELFGRVDAYRSRLRAELMDTQLDDGHDLDGNTLYRLNFDAVVMPWMDRRSPPGTAIFVMTVRQPDGEDEEFRALRERDNVELLHEWQREMQFFLSRVLEERVADFRRHGVLRNVADPKEDIALDRYLRRRLVGGFLQLVARMARPDCDTRACSDADWPDAEEERVKRLAGWLSLARPDGEITGDVYDPALRLSFRHALEVAGDVDRAQWPKADPINSYDQACIRKLEEDAARSMSPAGAGADDPEVLLVGNAAAPTAPEDPRQPQAADATDPWPPDACLAPLDDPRQQRALMRLFAVVQAMQRFHAMAGDRLSLPLTLSRPDAAPPELAKLVDALGQIVPSRTKVAEIFNEVKNLQPARHLASSLVQLGDACPAFAEYESKNEEISVDAMIADAQCHFLRSRAEVVREVLAGFIVARIKGKLKDYVGSAQPPLAELLDIDLEGCPLTDCRLAVQLRAVPEGDLAAYADRPSPGGKSNERITPTERYLAGKLIEYLGGRENVLTVYEVAPRYSGRVGYSARSRDTSISANSPAGDHVPLGIDLAQSARRTEVAVAPGVIGFGQIVGRKETTPDEETAAVFGWAVRPARLPDGSWKPDHHRLSVVLSAPSWWKRLNVDIVGCWVTPQRARSLGVELFDEPVRVCEPSAKSAGPVFRRSFRVQLPRRIDEVVERFNFDFIKTPYFYRDWLESAPSAPALPVGRAGHIVLAGERLWRGTVVTVAGQPADRITVLPDMKGVIAEFDCIERPGDMPGLKPNVLAKEQRNQGEQEKQEEPVQVLANLTVWTAEGRTNSLKVNLRQFEPDHLNERPCYVDGTSVGSHAADDIE